MFVFPGCQPISVNTLLCDTLGLVEITKKLDYLGGARVLNPGPTLTGPTQANSMASEECAAGGVHAEIGSGDDCCKQAAAHATESSKGCE